MKIRILQQFIPIISFLGIFALAAPAQVLTGSVKVNSKGSFANPGPSGFSNGLIDNDLTNGYTSGFDLTDAPTGMSPTGAVGTAAFQWGIAATNSTYNHTSALWFQPLLTTSVPLEQTFNLGYLHYRNGTIAHDSGATSVDLKIALSVTSGTNTLTVQNLTYHQLLINTQNIGDQISNADIVTLENTYAPLDFTDGSGRRFYLEMTYKPDQTTIDNSLSTSDEFRVFEGGTGTATLFGRITTSNGLVTVPEPSGMMLSLLSLACLGMRRHRAGAGNAK